MEKRNKIHIILIGLIVCYLYSNIAHAQQLFSTNNSDTARYKTLIDNSEELNIKDILLNNTDYSNYEYIPQLFTQQILLCHLSVLPDKRKNQVFIVNCPNTIDLKIFSSYRNDSTGEISVRENPYTSFTNNYIFELPYNTVAVVIKIKTSEFILFNISKVRKELVFNKKRNLFSFYGIANGILLLLILYHSILFLIVREKIYRFYILQIVISSAYLIMNWGIVVAQVHHIYFKTIQIIFFFIYILVFWIYLKSTINNKKAKFVYIGILTLCIATGMFDLIFPSYISKLVLHSFYLLLTGSFVIFTIKYYPQKPFSYQCFLISWLILFIGQFAFSAIDLFSFHNIPLLNHAFEIGILVNIILLAFAFGNNLNIYKSEKNRAEISEVEALKEKEKLILEQKIILEKLIIERNQVLINKIEISENQKQEIEAQNIIIDNRIKEIEKINNELIQKNIEISSQNKELEKHHILLEETVEKRTKKLIKAKERAVIADKLKTSFLNNLTQEINIPMNAITGYSGIITDKELSKEARNEYLQKIIKYVDILLESVDNIVTLSRIQAGIIKSRKTEISLVELINSIQLIFREKIDASEKKINFKIQFAEIDYEMILITDIDKIKQISNIFSDTIVKQTTEGEIEIKFKYHKSENIELNKKDKLIFNIIFSFPNHTQNKIIDLIKKFITNNDDNVKYSNHLELGLAICKGLLKILKAKAQIYFINENFSKLKLIIPVSQNLQTKQ